jgi:hypothetical protein
VGHSVDDLVAWLDAAPGLALSGPTTVTVGGLDGVQLDLQLDAAWNKTCFLGGRSPAQNEGHRPRAQASGAGPVIRF